MPSSDSAPNTVCRWPQSRRFWGAHPALLAALPSTEVSMVADSRLTNLERVAAADLGLPTLLLRPPAPRTAARTVQVADASLNSSLVTMQALSEAAEMVGTRHGVIVMVDVGDLREGVWPDHVVDLVSQASHLPGLDILGLGTNLACYGGVIPTADKMELLVDLRDEASRVTGLPLELISGGNSANLPLMVSGQMPAQIQSVAHRRGCNSGAQHSGPQCVAGNTSGHGGTGHRGRRAGTQAIHTSRRTWPGRFRPDGEIRRQRRAVARNL